LAGGGAESGTLSPDFHELFDMEAVPAEEQQRLQHVHELLVQAGPPAELTPALEQPPAPPEPATVTPLAHRRRRTGFVLVLAAALTAAAFAVGYVSGHHTSSAAQRVVSLQGGQAVGTLSVGAKDSAGNWPIDFKVSGLRVQTERYAYYELFLVRHGKPDLPCGGFKVGAGETSVHFDVPYSIKPTSRWIVTAISHRQRWPGRTVMT
jgi:hypothetical protein